MTRKVKTLIIGGLFILLMLILSTNSNAMTVNQLKAKFPAGKFWNHYTNDKHEYVNYEDIGTCNNPDGYTNEECPNHLGGVGNPDCNSFDKGQQCTGFARKLFYDYYGEFATNRPTHSDKWSIKPGDVVRYGGFDADEGGHEVWVIGITSGNLVVGDCNRYKRCEISWDRWIPLDKITIKYVYSADHAINDNVDTEPPTISEAFVDPTSMNGTSYTVNVNASDNVGLSKIPLMTWTIENGQDDIKEYKATKSGSYYKCIVTASNHNNEKGLYKSSVYAYDEAGNGTSKGLSNIPMGSRIVTTLGDSFIVRIVSKKNPNYVITTSGTTQNANVMLGKKSTSDEGQIWKFIKKNDGKSYEIVNLASNRALDIKDAKDEDGTNVEIYTRNNTNAQTYYIMEYNGGYRIVPKCTSNVKALDVVGGTIQNGQNIDLYNAYTIDNAAQTFLFEKIEDMPDDYRIKLNYENYQLNSLSETLTLKDEKLKYSPITWSSSNTKIASVDSNGKVTPKAGGFVYITATTQKYGTAKCWIYVCALRKLPNGSQAYPGDLDRNGIFNGTDASMLLDLKYRSDKLTADQIALCDINGNGIIDDDDKEILLSYSFDSKFSPGEYTPIQKINLNKTSAVLDPKDILNLTVTSISPVENTDGPEIRWISSDEKVATVDSTGKVIAQAPGTVKIKAIALSGVYAECNVTVPGEVVSNVMYGDVNKDTKITSVDAIITLMMSTGGIKGTDEQKKIADVSGDEKITLADAILILMRSVNSKLTFPVERQ